MFNNFLDVLDCVIVDSIYYYFIIMYDNNASQSFSVSEVQMAIKVNNPITLTSPQSRHDTQ